ncbi:MAG: hypothetical protein E7629_05190 [Ruminococcaceae bacterium]|nr:hypothetical protein [Oscillospiraceae bacterium]
MKKYQETVEAILNLNPHLRAYRRKKLAAFWIRLVLLELVVMAATVYLMSFGLKAAPALGIGLAILLPVFALKPKRTFGMRMRGRITKIDHERRQVYDPMAAGRASVRGATILSCAVENADGRSSCFDVPKRCVKVYREGDEVIGISGIPYPIVLTPHEWILCPLCGGVMPAVNETCVECGAQRIKSADMTIID